MIKQINFYQIFFNLSTSQFQINSTKYQRNNVECQLWTKEELKKLQDLAIKYNKNWELISEYFENRQPNSLKTKFNYELRKQKRKQALQTKQNTVKIVPTEFCELNLTTTEQINQNILILNNQEQHEKSVEEMERQRQVTIDQQLQDCPFLCDNEQLISISFDFME